MAVTTQTDSESVEDQNQKQPGVEAEDEKDTDATDAGETTDKDSGSTEEVENDSAEPDETDTNDGESGVREKVKRANDEAAKYRRRLRDTEAEVKSLTESQEKLEADLAEKVKLLDEREKRVAELELEVTVGSVMREFGIPDDMREFVTGEDAESIRGSAKKLASFIKRTYGPRRVDGPLGGLSPSVKDDDDSLSPGELAAKYGGRR